MEFSVIVTGASGFVGSSLVKKLKSIQGINVIPVSRSGNDATHFNVKNYRDAPTGDVLIHLAENSDRLSINNSGENHINDSEITMEAMIAKGYSKIIYCSSSVVYGGFGNEPYTEKSPVYSVDNYTRLKLNNEQRVLSTGGIVARLTNIIGLGMAKNNVLSDILSQLPGNGLICVRNDKPVRDFIWIDDVVDALILLILEGSEGIFNIGTGVSVSIRQMAETVLNVVGKKDNIVKTIEISQPFSYNVVDISKIKNAYRWSPKSTLNQSIKLMVSGL